MDDLPPYDPRAIANSLLELAWKFDLPVTHLSLQKTIYFLHAQFLREFHGPLCKGYFEAWKHGPVHPQIWSAFRNSGRGVIRHCAYGMDIKTGIPKKIAEISNRKVLLFLSTKGLELLTIPAPRLVGMSHVPGGPWDRVTRDSRGQREYGGRISDELIVQSRNSRMVSVSDSIDLDEEPYEQPPA